MQCYTMIKKFCIMSFLAFPCSLLSADNVTESLGVLAQRLIDLQRLLHKAKPTPAHVVEADLAALLTAITQFATDPDAFVAALTQNEFTKMQTTVHAYLGDLVAKINAGQAVDIVMPIILFTRIVLMFIPTTMPEKLKLQSFDKDDKLQEPGTIKNVLPFIWKLSLASFKEAVSGKKISIAKPLKQLSTLLGIEKEPSHGGGEEPTTRMVPAGKPTTPQELQKSLLATIDIYMANPNNAIAELTEKNLKTLLKRFGDYFKNPVTKESSDEWEEEGEEEPAIDENERIQRFAMNVLIINQAFDNELLKTAKLKLDLEKKFKTDQGSGKALAAFVQSIQPNAVAFKEGIQHEISTIISVYSYVNNMVQLHMDELVVANEVTELISLYNSISSVLEQGNKLLLTKILDLKSISQKQKPIHAYFTARLQNLSGMINTAFDQLQHANEVFIQDATKHAEDEKKKVTGDEHQKAAKIAKIASDLKQKIQQELKKKVSTVENKDQLEQACNEINSIAKTVEGNVPERVQEFCSLFK